MTLTGKEKEDFDKFINDLNELKRILIDWYKSHKDDYVTNEYNPLFDRILFDMLDFTRNFNIYTMDIYLSVIRSNYFGTYFYGIEITNETSIDDSHRIDNPNDRILRGYLRIKLLDLFTNDTHRKRD